MEITRFGQECFFVRSGGVMLLVNPGKGCFSEASKHVLDYGKFLSGLPNVNVCVVTSEHEDDYDLGFLKKLYEDCRTPFFFSTERVLRSTENELLFGMSDLLHEGAAVDLGEGVSIAGAGVNREKFGFLLDDGKTRLLYAVGELPAKVPNTGVAIVPQEAAAGFIKQVSPKVVIPVRYDHPGSGPADLVRLGGSQTTLVVLKSGETYNTD